MPVLKGGQVLSATDTAVADLTATAGAADNALADVGAAFSQAVLNDNFRDVATKINAIITTLEDAGIVRKS